MRPVAVVAIALVVGGCAMTPERFEQKRSTMSHVQVCRSALIADKSLDANFIGSTHRELEQRSLSSETCAQLITAEDQRNAAIALALVGVVALAAAASSGSGGGYAGGSSYAASTDYDWAWDQFYNQYQQLVWACRGMQTGQFVELWHCNSDPKNDYNWPGK